ncbi:phage adaptor protein [Paenibacillus sp. GYB003]|uniref:phage adaptor protein n=1 Tax=Paenibacillus sp. GYB003 TaxID=2994392 RepID=UPI002F9652F2
MLTLQQIIEEAYQLVPNAQTEGQEVIWLNAINQDFFNVVKIPKIYRFTTSSAGTYTLPTDVRQKNIDKVNVGVLKYRDLDNENVLPLQNAYNFDDGTKQLTLTPAPYTGGLTVTVRYYRIATTTFTTSNLNAVPDAPEEYQWTYIPALAAYLAQTIDDDTKAANFENQVRSAWNVAAQNYVGTGAA